MHEKGDYERVEIIRAVERKQVDVDVEMCMKANCQPYFLMNRKSNSLINWCCVVLTWRKKFPKRATMLPMYIIISTLLQCVVVKEEEREVSLVRTPHIISDYKTA